MFLYKKNNNIKYFFGWFGIAWIGNFMGSILCIVLENWLSIYTSVKNSWFEQISELIQKSIPYFMSLELVYVDTYINTDITLLTWNAAFAVLS